MEWLAMSEVHLKKIVEKLRVRVKSKRMEKF